MNSTGRTVIGSLLILVGLLFLFDTTGAFTLGELFRTYWPILLIIGGTVLLLRSRGAGGSPRGVVDQSTLFGDTVSTAATDELNSSTVFGNYEVRVTSRSFRGGSISTVFGDTAADLSGVEFAEGEQRLKINGVFGDLNLRLPVGAAYAVRATAVFGSVTVDGQRREGFSNSLEIASAGFATASRKLRIELAQVFGDVLVTSQA
jgi:predicted membrane protein